MASPKAPRGDQTTPKTAGAELGSKGAEIAKLNRYLGKFGYFGQTEHIHHHGSAIGADDGAANPPPDENVFGAETEAALRKFQSKNGLAVTGKLDEATVNKMGQKRCGNPDLGAYNDSGRKWNKNDLTYGFQNFTSDLTEAEIRQAISAAFGYWAAVTPLTFTEVNMAGNPDIIIRFVSGDHGDGSPFDGQSGVLAHAFYPEQGAISGDTHFDEAETWSVDLPASGIDLYTVAAHEFGHALGLGHSSVSDALMAPYYGGPRRALHQDDIDGIQAIYGSEEWLNNKALSSVYATYHSKNAWAYIAGVGWKKCKPDKPEAVTSMFAALCAARANAKTVTVQVTNDQITQIYA